MKNVATPQMLYFLVYDGYFKIGLTTNLRRRILQINKDIEEEINFEDSFFYKLSQSSATALETNLKRSYGEFMLRGEIYPTETLLLSCLNDVKKDVKDYHELFKYETSEVKLTDSLMGYYETDGTLKIYSASYLFTLYEKFNGNEEYYKNLFKPFELAQQI